MSDNFTITPDMLSDAILEQMEIYRKSTQLKIDKCGIKAMKNMVRTTKDTAPFNAKHHGRHYVDCIASKREISRLGIADYTWYVKSPCYRLTHLLVKGHVKRNGSRTRKDPFLENAANQAKTEFLEGIEKALKDGN